jgi:hypothetical protein
VRVAVFADGLAVGVVVEGGRGGIVDVLLAIGRSWRAGLERREGEEGRRRRRHEPSQLELFGSSEIWAMAAPAKRSARDEMRNFMVMEFLLQVETSYRERNRRLGDLERAPEEKRNKRETYQKDASILIEFQPDSSLHSNRTSGCSSIQRSFPAYPLQVLTSTTEYRTPPSTLPRLPRRRGLQCDWR